MGWWRVMNTIESYTLTGKTIANSSEKNINPYPANVKNMVSF